MMYFFVNYFINLAMIFINLLPCRYNKDVMKLVKLDSLEELANLPVTKWNIQQPADINGKEDALSSGI